MDIGDPSEIPATRKKLPSMQELGAFDLAGPPPKRRAVAHDDTGKEPRQATPEMTTQVTEAATAALLQARPPSGEPPATTQPVPPTAPGVSRDPSTAEQLREALTRADPDTRRKLLRLIAGGQSVQQLGNPAAPDGVQRRSLVMNREPSTGAAPRVAPGKARAEPSRPVPGSGARASPGPVASRQPAGNGAPLMQIDANTQLFDAAAPAPTAAQRQAALQAQVDAGLQAPAVQRRDATADPAAHKVLFPAYDPDQHGTSVASPVRRRKEAPVEGHYPAPHQPFQATYRHADGRPMTAEENKVEEVLQEQRCDETLSVLARDGVNGLLLSPRDLDAAVANGLLPAETAATLWKTWAALRPVIHVIEDEPEASTLPSMAELLADTSPVNATEHTAASATPAAPEAKERSPGDSHDFAPPTQPAKAGEIVMQRVEVEAVAPARPETVHHEASVLAEPTLPLRTSAPEPAARMVEPASPTLVLPLSTPRLRLTAMLRTLGWLFVAFCVVSTTARLAMWAWLRWGHLSTGG